MEVGHPGAAHSEVELRELFPDHISPRVDGRRPAAEDFAYEQISLPDDRYRIRSRAQDLAQTRLAFFQPMPAIDVVRRKLLTNENAQLAERDRGKHRKPGVDDVQSAVRHKRRGDGPREQADSTEGALPSALPGRE